MPFKETDEMNMAWHMYCKTRLPGEMVTAEMAFKDAFEMGSFGTRNAKPAEPDDDYDSSEDRRQGALMLAIKANPVGIPADALISEAKKIEAYLRGGDGERPKEWPLDAPQKDAVDEIIGRYEDREVSYAKGIESSKPVDTAAADTMKPSEFNGTAASESTEQILINLIVGNTKVSVGLGPGETMDQALDRARQMQQEAAVQRDIMADNIRTGRFGWCTARDRMEACGCASCLAKLAAMN